MSFEVGQKVWSPLFGWSIIYNKNSNGDGEIVILINDWYYVFLGDGRYRYESMNNPRTFYSRLPLLFHDEIKLEDWPNPQRNPALDLKVDDLILVSVNNYDWVPRYFSYCEGDLVYVYINGTTSKTYKSVGVKTAPFKYWKKPE
jgi:hypothetical protein